jgi:hypothetical protein
MCRFLAVLAVVVLWSLPADAQRSRAHFSFGFVFPFYIGPGYYPPPAYYPPPVYYPPDLSLNLVIPLGHHH